MIYDQCGWHLPQERNKSERLQTQRPAMSEDFEVADCQKDIADQHDDFGLVIEWCA